MSIFLGLALVMVTAAVGGVIAKMLRQPLILGYAVVGSLLSAFGFTNFPEIHNILDSFGQLGVTLLLFLVGLELPLSQLRQVGKTALIVGVSQVLLVFILGTLISGSPYIGLGLAFSSTIVVVKILTEKKDLASLHGKLSVGILLVQDFVAIGALIFLAGANVNPLWVIGKGVVLILFFTWGVAKILPKITTWLGQSTEMLFVGTLAWCLAVAAFVSLPWVGFSVELGGFLAGIALANASEHLQISSRIRPLRDFFLTLFFVSLGANLNLSQLSESWGMVAVLTLFVVIIKPLIVMGVLIVRKYSLRVAFMTGISLAQISEFSLLLAALAVRSGQADKHIYAVVAVVGLITMLVGNYLFLHANILFRFLSKYLKRFVHNQSDKNKPEKKLKGHIILFGHNRVGGIIRPILKNLGKPLMVVDFDPQVVEKLKNEDPNLNVVYGDIADEDLYEDLRLLDAELIVSTVTDCDDNLLVLNYINKNKKHPLTIFIASDAADASAIYEAKADLVIVPHSMGGEYLVNLFENKGLDRDFIIKRGKLHAQNL